PPPGPLARPPPCPPTRVVGAPDGDGFEVGAPVVGPGSVGPGLLGPGSLGVGVGSRSEGVGDRAGDSLGVGVVPGALAGQLLTGVGTGCAVASTDGTTTVPNTAP